MNLFTEYFALDIGTWGLKAFAVGPGPSGEGYLVTDCLAETLAPGLVGGGFTNPRIGSGTEFSAAARRLLARLDSTKEGCILGLPDRWVKMHLVELTLKPHELASREFLAWRLRKSLSLPDGLEVVIDQQVLGAEETDDGLRCQVMAGAVRRDLLTTVCTLLADLNVEVMAIDTSSLGVYNLLEDLHPENTLDRHLAICHIGHETTVVKFFQNGRISYERVIEVGGEEFTKQLGAAESLEPEKAQDEKCARKFFPQTKQEMLTLVPHRESISRIFGNWLRELNVTFRFYQEKFKVMRLPRLYLTGGSCLFAGLPEFLADFFDTACERFNPVSGIPSPGPIDEKILALGPTFAPAVGLLAR